jgi:neutral ceramidase
MRFLLLFVWSVSVVLVPSAFGEDVFKVGFAKVDITPTKPVPMWGYGDRHAMLSQGTRDPLYAKAVVIQAGDQKMAIVGLDLGRGPGDPEFGRIKEAVNAQAGVSMMMMSGSHTHHGPVIEMADREKQGKGSFDDAVAYRAELEAKLIGVVVEAAGKLEPARVGWNSEQVDMNRNRHSKKKVKPRDTELSVIRFDDLDGKPLAVVVNYSAHPTILAAADLRFSAEYPGVMMNTVEAAMNTNCVFMQGSAGDMSVQTTDADQMPDGHASLDVNNLPATQRDFLMSAMKLSEEDAVKQQQNMVRNDWRMEHYGKRLGDVVVEIAKDTKTERPAKPSVQGDYSVYDFESRVNFENSFIVGMFGMAFFPELANAMVEMVDGNRIKPRLSVTLLNGQLAMVGGSGEFFCQHANRLKERSGVEKTLFFGYCNGHHMYFPTIEGVAEGGYGADPEVSWVEVGAGEKMMNDALITLYEFQGEISREQMGATK